MKQVIWVIVVLLVIWGVYALATKNDASDQTTPAPVDQAADTAVTPTPENALIVADQKPGKEVTVTSYVLTVPGYMVVHKVAANDTPGDVLGVSALLPAGQSAELKVALTAATKDGDKIIVMMHTDDADGKFDVTKDVPATNIAGTVIVTLVSVKK